MGKKYVLTHIKADFDAISSAWGVLRLHGCDAVLIASEPEPNVVSYFKTRYGGLPPEIVKIRAEDLDCINDIDEIYITDCMHRKRLGVLEPLLEKAGVVCIYDHHTTHIKDIESRGDHIRKTGSCATIVVQELVLSEGCISEDDATLYLLGIYEDTGMLTFSGTTGEDARVAAALIEAGGDTTVITDFVKQDFTREQVFVLNELLMNLVNVVIGGYNISYSFASIEEYMPEMAFLTQRMMDMEELEVLIVAVRNGPSISIVGRSRNPNVDVSRVVARFDGGGHPAAAAANVKDLELHEVIEMLKLTLREQIRPVKYLRELMNSPVKSIDVNSLIQDALDFTLVHNLNHMPVVYKGRTVGILSRKDILQGIKHGLAQEPVSLLMQVEFESFSPDTPFAEAECVMLSNGQKLIPVEENGELKGVVTRTDIFRLIQEESVVRSAYEEVAKTRLGLSKNRNVKELMKTELSSVQYKYLKEIGAVAEEDGVAAYVVGGFVRDLLMGFSNIDMDIVLEGDATVTAINFARKKAAKVTVHDRYKTASVHLNTGDKVDFATARTEYYCNPGAVPSMEFGSLRNDLMRRDFTINAMAVRLDGEDFGMLVDYFGGQRDILDKKIRVLHSLSFVDDPTRAFRAVRFAARLGFELGDHTERLMKHAGELDLYSRIQGAKLFIEVKYILSEERYMQSLILLKKYKMLHFIAADLRIDANKESQFAFLEEFYKRCHKYFEGNVTLWEVRFAVLLSNYIYPDAKAILQKLHVELAVMDRIIGIYNKSRNVLKAVKYLKAPKPSDVYRLFDGFTNDELLMSGVLLKEQRSYIIVEYLENYRGLKPRLNGNDLMRLGISPSPEMGEILHELLFARLDGSLVSKEAEEEYVRSKYARQS